MKIWCTVIYIDSFIIILVSVYFIVIFHMVLPLRKHSRDGTSRTAAQTMAKYGGQWSSKSWSKKWWLDLYSSNLKLNNKYCWSLLLNSSIKINLIHPHLHEYMYLISNEFYWYFQCIQSPCRKFCRDPLKPFTLMFHCT